MQPVPCAARNALDRLCRGDTTLNLYSNAKDGMCYLYEVDIYRTQAITYIGGHNWRKYIEEERLKRGDTLFLSYGNESQVFAHAHRSKDRQNEGNLICLYSLYPLITTLLCK